MREPEQSQADGLHETFDVFFALERDPVLGLAFALIGDRAVAEDVVQDAFLEAFRKWDRIGGFDQPGAWVRRVVANMSVSTFRRRRSELRMLTKLGARQNHVLPDLSPSTLAFWQAVRALPKRQAQVTALFYVEDRPIAEIAEILQMAEGTVKKHLHDGRKTLARTLELDEVNDERR
ncbi:MAG: RNA polymerase sigma factor [Solirubrobacterales bacterium]